MKHITKNRPQMVSITKLYLILRKKLLFVSVLPIEKSRSYRITMCNKRSNTHGFHVEFYALFFARKQISILTLQLSALLPCIRQQIKGEKSDEIRHSSLISSKPHEVKSTDMHCILTTNIVEKKRRGGKNARSSPRQCFQLPSRRISNLRSGPI